MILGDKNNLKAVLSEKIPLVQLNEKQHGFEFIPALFFHGKLNF